MLYRNYSSPEPDPLRRVQVGVAAEIILGSPRKDCKGVGICRIERADFRHRNGRPSREEENQCRRAKALLMGQKNGQSIVFYFVKHSLPECCRSRQFQQGVFCLEESVCLPWDIALELGCPAHSRLSEGQYKVVELGMHWAVTIQVEKGRPSLEVLN